MNHSEKRIQELEVENFKKSVHLHAMITERDADDGGGEMSQLAKQVEDLAAENRALKSMLAIRCADVAQLGTRLDLAEKLIGEEWAGSGTGEWKWCRCCESQSDEHNPGCIRAKWFRMMEE